MKDENKTPQTVVHNVSSHKQSGGITAHTVNIGQQRRTLTSEISFIVRQQLLDLDRSKKYKVTAIMGDAEAYSFAKEIFEFLGENGFNLVHKEVAQALFMTPISGSVIQNKGPVVELIIGQNPL